jgi:hypothetical protein
MNNHRRAILQLVAMGRVTPAQAERLLLAVDDGREILWPLAACVAACLAQINLRELLPRLAHTAHALLPGSLLSLQHALSLLTHLFGGVL